jgi:hypothetical protein
MPLRLPGRDDSLGMKYCDGGKWSMKYCDGEKWRGNAQNIYLFIF